MPAETNFVVVVWTAGNRLKSDRNQLRITLNVCGSDIIERPIQTHTEIGQETAKVLSHTVAVLYNTLNVFQRLTFRTVTKFQAF